MGFFGKYGIRILCSNGDEGFVMEIDRREDGVLLTNNKASAQRFATSKGAKDYFERIRNMTVFDFEG